MKHKQANKPKKKERKKNLTVQKKFFFNEG